MSTIVATHFVSLDGKVDPTGGDPELHDTAWTFKTVAPAPEAYELKGREQLEAGAMLIGRVSYDEFAPVWPTMVDEFAEYNAMPKYVVSTTLTEADLTEGWGETTILRSLDDVAKLKEGDGAPIIVHGSATLAKGLAAAGLVDRYHLLVFPLVLGSGKRLFGEGDKTKLALVEHAAYSNGITLQRYDVVR